MTWTKNIYTKFAQVQKKQYLCGKIIFITMVTFTKNISSALRSFLSESKYEEIVVVAAEKIVAQWQQKGFEKYPILSISSGESCKSLEGLQRIWDFLLEHNITRRGLMICVGGGTITDLGGLAAATYKRGIDYINIPTTLLSMVDASVGGKTGINYRGLKNVIGAFHEPVQTIISMEWLQTLPTDQLLSGYAEMIKTSFLSDGIAESLLFQYDLDAFDLEALEPLVKACVEIKKSIVEIDVFEANQRKALNFGHTFGHALEQMQLDSHPILHGYAVLWGMIAELYLSVTLSGCPREPLQQLTQIMIHYYGRPQCKCTNRAQLIELMQQDKKNEHSGEINCTLLQTLGQPLVNQVITPAQAEEAWEYLFSL